MGCVGSRVDVEADGRQYHLRKLIASGGFSQIFSAEDLESGRRVAIKRIACHFGDEADRTYREIEVHRRFGLADVSHDDDERDGPEEGTTKASTSNGATSYTISENRVRLDSRSTAASKNNNNNNSNGHCNAGGGGGSRYVMPILGVAEERLAHGQLAFSLIFPLCKLGSLQDELASRRPTKDYIPEQRVLRLFRQVCSALEVLHAARPPIAHRDLKPANLLLRSAEHLLLTDFGSAMECPIVIGDARQRRAVLDAAAEFCTMPYRAPELFTCETGTQLDESVDIWSLGCVLYAMCYFCSPYDEVHERGDSVALAVQSARFKFDAEAPFGKSTTSLIGALVRFAPADRPPISAILQRLDALT